MGNFSGSDLKPASLSFLKMTSNQPFASSRFVCCCHPDVVKVSVMLHWRTIEASSNDIPVITPFAIDDADVLGESSTTVDSISGSTDGPHTYPAMRHLFRI